MMVVGQGPTKAVSAETPPTKIERNHSNSSESNTGWESGDDESSTDLDLTDHSEDDKKLLFDKSPDTPPFGYGFAKQKAKDKLRNPWKKASLSNKNTDKNQTSKQNVNEKANKAGNRSASKVAGPNNRKGQDRRKKMRELTKSFCLDKVKSASNNRGNLLFKNAGVNLVRTTSKRFSTSFRDRSVANPPKETPVTTRKGVAENKKVSYRTNKFLKCQQNFTPLQKAGIFREPLDVTNHFSKPRKSSFQGKNRRQATKRVPSDLAKLWKRQLKENTGLVLQWAFWEHHVQELVKPPTLVRWVSFNATRDDCEQPVIHYESGASTSAKRSETGK